MNLAAKEQSGDKLAQYLRAVITCELKAFTSLHIGAGGQSRPTEQGSGNVLDICRGVGELPYLPATSLRGLLLGCYRTVYGERNVLRLFGSQDSAGVLSFSNCFLVSDGKLKDALSNGDISGPCGIRSHTTIDPITRVAAEHRLFQVEYVRPGRRFFVEIRTDVISHCELVELVQLILGLSDDNPHAVLGMGRTHGMGRVAIVSDSLKVQAATSDELSIWLDKEGDEPFEDCFRDITGEVVISNTGAPSRGGEELALELIVHFDSSLLINDPARVSPDKDGKPKLQYSRDGRDAPVLEATSLRGVFRARARKILLSKAVVISEGEIDERNLAGAVDAILARIFGGPKIRSAITVHAPTFKGESSSRIRRFNAIDRFTGGVADKKLYSANAADIFGSFCCRISIKEQFLAGQSEWWKALLLFVLRDYMEGDLQVGWGSSKGLGYCHAGVNVNGAVYNCWDEVRVALDSERTIAEKWISDLDREIGDTLKSEDNFVSKHKVVGL